jgi:hypothetical protein
MCNKTALSILLVLLPISLPKTIVSEELSDRIESEGITDEESFDDESFFDVEENFEQPVNKEKQSSAAMFWVKRFGLRMLLLYEDVVFACKRILSR